jgi:hypothetical protein
MGQSSRSSGEFEGHRDQLQSTRRCVFVDQIDNSSCSSQDGSNSIRLRSPLLRCLSRIGENLLQIQLDESSVQGKRRWKPCRFGTRLQRFRNRARVEHRVPARTVGQQFQIVVVMHAHQRPFQSSSQLWSCATHASCISNQCSKQNFGALCYVHTRVAPQSLQAQHLLYTRSHGGKQQVLSTSIFFCFVHAPGCMLLHLPQLLEYNGINYSVTSVLRQPHCAPRLLVSGRTRSTSTSPCAATTRLRLHALYVDLVVNREYSSPLSRLQRSTSPPPCVRVPRHVARHVTRLVAPLTVDYSGLVVDYFTSAARPGASARRAARHAARCATRRRLLRLAQARRRLLRLCRASGCLGTSRDPSRGSSSTTPYAATTSSSGRIVLTLHLD